MKDFFRSYCWEIILLLIIGGLMAVWLNGCSATTRKSATVDTVQHDVFVVTMTIPFPMPQLDGTVKMIDMPICGKVVKDGSTISKSEATAATTLQGPEFGSLIVAAIRQAFPIAGALMGPPPSKDYTAEIIAGVTALGGATGLVAKIRGDAKRIQDAKADAEYHKADAIEGWSKVKT